MRNKEFKMFMLILIFFMIGISCFGIYKNSLREKVDENGIIVSDDSLKIFGEENENSEVNSDDTILMVDNDVVASATDLTIAVNGDLVTLNYDYAGSFYYNTVSSYNSSVKITKGGGAISGKNGYISLKNGTYYFYTYNYNTFKAIAKGPVNITKSCKNETRLNQTGTFTFQRCATVNSSGSVTLDGKGTTIATCASGYKMQSYKSTDNCSSKTLLNGLSTRYCSVNYTATCSKQSSGSGSSVAAAKLSALSVSSGSLSPSFKSSTKSYTVKVSSDVSSIKINATAGSGSSFVSGYGSRTVKLNYGSNTIKVKVKNSANKVTTYTIKVTRTDNRSSTNTLSNLKTNVGTLSPAFTSDVTNYTVDVANDVSSISIEATLTDNKSSFVAGYGPGSTALSPGLNKIYIKVQNEKGEVNVYTINVNRETTPSVCTTNAEELALLKGIILSVDINGVELDQIEDFDPKVYSYDVEVPYKVSNLTVEALTQDEEDGVVVEGNNELEVDVSRAVKITVTSKTCPNVTTEYTLNVTRQPEKQLGSNGELTNIIVAGHEDEIEFTPEQTNYGITLSKNETELEISYEKREETTTCEIQGNEELGVGSIIEITCKSEDGDDIQKYTISINGVKKGTNVFLIVIVVIIVILILIYLVLRLLGYRIYFNAAVIGAFFRGIGEKIKNVFDK